ncbi:hypothetical protein Bca4012_072956 [Brassica carinata]|uniref:Uncharacterized protein n=1 Tax=Brassica carinata TaxID=52824 RepID=A0A8X7UCA2_BRACI|nr:hypothetical protein Bca52824_065296 [Brassica carinata]
MACVIRCACSYRQAKFERPSSGPVVPEENFQFVFNLLGNQNDASSSIPSLPWLLCNIWKKRNTILYADTQDSGAFMLHTAEEEANLWFAANAKGREMEGHSDEISKRKRWIPPETGVLKFNMHANWRYAQLQSGMAWIAQDYRGDVKHHARDVFICSPSRLVAEF